MKNSNKVKKIIIAIIAVIIIAAITVGILLATGVWDVNLSKKSKMSAGIEKCCLHYIEGTGGAG